MPSSEFYVTGIGTGILTCVGAITISFSIVILTKIRTHFAFNLLGLSLFDFVFLVSSFVVYSLPIFDPDLLSDKWAEGIESLNDFSHAGSIYFTILIATERCIALYCPFKSLCMDLRQRTRSFLQWSVVALLAAAAQLLKLLDYESLSEDQLSSCDVNTTEYFSSHGSVSFHYVDYYVQIPYIMCIIIGPFVCLTVLNTLVIFKVHRSNGFRKASACVGGNSMNTTPALLENNCTMIMLMIVALFLICQTGCLIVIVCRYFFLCFYLNWESTLYSIDIFLLNLNSSLNFFIYWVYGSKFREHFKSILRWRS